MIRITLSRQVRLKLSVIGFVIFVLFPQPGYSGALADELYFTFKLNSVLPATPSSLLVLSPSFIKVPAGTVLSVHLLRGDQFISTSKLTFQKAFESERLIPSVPIASFVPSGGGGGAGQPLPNATLISGVADLAKVATEPSQYRLLWVLTEGIMGTPGRAVVTGSPVSFVDLQLTAVTASALVGDQKPGSILFFNRYTSSPSNPSREDTQLNLTNSSSTSPVFIRLFLVNGSSCDTTTIDLCLTPQQTVNFQMSDLDPGVKGYAIAVAMNAQGQPIRFNWLIGNAIVKQTASNLAGSFSSIMGAVAVAKRSQEDVPNQNGLAEMLFDDLNYDRLPGQVAFDSVPSQANALNLTTLSLYRPLPDLRGGPGVVPLKLSAWGQGSGGDVPATSGNLSTACYTDVAVGSLRLSPITVAQILPSGSTGWFAVMANDNLPVLGAQLTSGGFSGGNNSRPLTFSAEYKITLAVQPVTCPQ